MSKAVKCLILLAVVALFFVTELIPLAITAMGGAIACGLLGLIPAKQVFSGLSNSNSHFSTELAMSKRCCTTCVIASKVATKDKHFILF